MKSDDVKMENLVLKEGKRVTGWHMSGLYQATPDYIFSRSKKANENLINQTHTYFMITVLYKGFPYVG